MKYWTLAEMKEQQTREMGIEDEVFIDSNELAGYYNNAIDEAEAEIHGLFQNYFRARASISFENGVEGVDMPENIYAMKILEVRYRNGSVVSKIEEIPETKQIDLYEQYKANNTLATGGGFVGYFVDNTTPGEPKIIFVPTPGETGAYGSIWYLRNANRLTEDDDICDIPEFVSFIFAYTRYWVLFKEGHPNTQLAGIELEKQRSLMQATLASRAAAPAPMVEPDMSHYEEHV